MMILRQVGLVGLVRKDWDSERRLDQMAMLKHLQVPELFERMDLPLGSADFESLY